MISLYEFIKAKDVRMNKYPLTEAELGKIEALLSAKFGPQVKEFLLKYAYLRYKTVEICGINSLQQEKSRMVTQTLYVHQYFPQTMGLVVFSEYGEGNYCLADENDGVYLLDTELETLTKVNMCVFDFIVQMFLKEDEA